MKRHHARRLRLALFVSVAWLTALGTVLLGLGQQSSVLPTLAIVSSVTSLVFTDILGLILLRPWMTNLLMILCLGIVLLDVARQASYAHVLVVANLLVYLQCVLQFQKKDVRVFRYLMTLSIFQVVSASAFYHSMLFGALLVVYLLTGLAVMVLLGFLELWEAQEKQSKQELEGGSKAVFAGDVPPSTSGLGLNRSLWGRMALMGLGSCLFSLGVFVIVPRVGGRPWPGLAPTPLRTVGFNQSIRLGELGYVIEDPTPVMRLELTDMDGKPVDVSPPIYIRGGSYSHYRNGGWVADPFLPGNEIRNLEALFRGPGQTLLRQHILLEPIEGPDVFAIWPYGKWDNSPLLYDPRGTRLMRLADQTRRVSYELTTSAIREQRQVDLVPANEPVFIPEYLRLPWVEWAPSPWGGQFWIDRNLYQRRGWRRVEELAQEWAAECPSPGSDYFHVARFFEQQLAFSGYYRYSLKGVKRSEELDPVVDFLTENKVGHCEYFATALALLLRCRGLPTRVVVGFKCSDYNDLGHFYQVRQRDAHAWVEVYLAPDKITEELTPQDSKEIWRYGGWLRLDPSPISALGLGQGQNAFQRFWNTYNFLDYLWLKYVMQMDRPRQEKEIYRPIRERVRHRASPLLDARRWQEWLQQTRMAIANIGSRPARPIALAIVVLALCCVGVTAYRLRKNHLLLWLVLRFLPQRLQKLPVYDHFAVATYRQLEVLLRRYGFSRRPAQTPYHFVNDVIQSTAAVKDATQATAAVNKDTGRDQSLQDRASLDQASWQTAASSEQPSWQTAASSEQPSWQTAALTLVKAYYGARFHPNGQLPGGPDELLRMLRIVKTGLQESQPSGYLGRFSAVFARKRTRPAR